MRILEFFPSQKFLLLIPLFLYAILSNAQATEESLYRERRELRSRCLDLCMHIASLEAQLLKPDTNEEFLYPEYLMEATVEQLLAIASHIERITQIRSGSLRRREVCDVKGATRGDHDKLTTSSLSYELERFLDERDLIRDRLRGIEVEIRDRQRIPSSRSSDQLLKPLLSPVSSSPTRPTLSAPVSHFPSQPTRAPIAFGSSSSAAQPVLSVPERSDQLRLLAASVPVRPSSFVALPIVRPTPAISWKGGREPLRMPDIFSEFFRERVVLGELRHRGLASFDTLSSLDIGVLQEETHTLGWGEILRSVETVQAAAHNMRMESFQTLHSLDIFNIRSEGWKRRTSALVEIHGEQAEFFYHEEERALQEARAAALRLLESKVMETQHAIEIYALQHWFAVHSEFLIAMDSFSEEKIEEDRSALRRLLERESEKYRQQTTRVREGIAFQDFLDRVVEEERALSLRAAPASKGRERADMMTWQQVVLALQDHSLLRELNLIFYPDRSIFMKESFSRSACREMGKAIAALPSLRCLNTEPPLVFNYAMSGPPVPVFNLFSLAIDGVRNLFDVVYDEHRIFAEEIGKSRSLERVVFRKGGKGVYHMLKNKQDRDGIVVAFRASLRSGRLVIDQNDQEAIIMRIVR
jgi:hypothetical protein